MYVLFCLSVYYLLTFMCMYDLMDETLLTQDTWCLYVRIVYSIHAVMTFG